MSFFHKSKVQTIIFKKKVKFDMLSTILSKKNSVFCEVSLFYFLVDISRLGGGLGKYFRLHLTSGTNFTHLCRTLLKFHLILRQIKKQVEA